MEFFGKIRIESNKGRNIKKIWLTIGIISIIIAIIIEAIMGVYYIFSLLIPLLWLMRIRNTMQMKELFKDVAIKVDENNSVMSFLIEKSAYFKNALLDKRIVIPKNQIKSITYMPQSGKMILKGKAQTEYLFENRITKKIECNELCFYISNSDFSIMSNKYSLANKVSMYPKIPFFAIS